MALKAALGTDSVQVYKYVRLPSFPQGSGPLSTPCFQGADAKVDGKGPLRAIVLFCVVSENEPSGLGQHCVTVAEGQGLSMGSLGPLLRPL
jgi:hypothetical protein